MLDLGTQVAISQVVTHFYDGDPRTYTYYIEASNQGDDWKTLVPTKSGSSIVTDSFPQTTARFVRITILTNTNNPAAHIEEIRVYKPSHVIPSPALTISCQSLFDASNFKVEITGSLTSNGSSLSGLPVLLSDSVNGGKSWDDLILVTTENNGNFLAVWTPSITGNYLIKATWTGNSEYSATTTTISFALAPYEDKQTVFSVNSNSTLSAFYFDSASRQLTFSVTGEEGTTGYVDVYIPKSLVSDVSSFKVYLDGALVAYTWASQGETWRLSSSYHHSTHQVAVTLGSLLPSLPNQTSIEQWIAYVAVTAAIVAIVLFAVLIRRKKQLN